MVLVRSLAHHAASPFELLLVDLASGETLFQDVTRRATRERW